MNTKLIIKNFRVFDENGATIDLKPLTILTGCNSSGKSSIVKAAFLLNSFMKQVSNASDITPSWFKRGVEAALLAPTAVNQQKFSFEYVGMSNGHHQVLAKKGFSMIGYTQMDLGIAKYHFEIAAGIDKFKWL